MERAPANPESPTSHVRSAETAEDPRPRRSVWPIVLGFGLSLMLFGVVTNFVFGMVGFLLFLLGLGGWINEARHG